MEPSLFLEYVRTALGALILVSVWIGVRSYKANVEKIRIDKAQADYKTNFDLLTYFNSHRKDMEAVFQLKDLELKELLSNPNHVESANSICLVFHLLGSLVEAEESDDGKNKITEMFCQMFYFAIPHTRVILNDYIDHIRQKSHPSYWLGYDQLVVRTVKRHQKQEFIHLDTGEVGKKALKFAQPLWEKTHNNAN